MQPQIKLKFDGKVKLYDYPRYCIWHGKRPMNDNPEECSNCGDIVRPIQFWLKKGKITKAHFFQRFH